MFEKGSDLKPDPMNSYTIKYFLQFVEVLDYSNHLASV